MTYRKRCGINIARGVPIALILSCLFCVFSYAVHVRIATLSGLIPSAVGLQTDATKEPPTAEIRLQKIYNALPEGQTVKFDDFRQKLLPDLAKHIALIKATAITRHGNHIEMELLPNSFIRVSSNISVYFANKVKFDVQAVNQTFTLNNLEGAKVKVPFLSALESKEINLTYNADGSLTIQVKLRLSNGATIPIRFKTSTGGLKK